MKVVDNREARVIFAEDLRLLPGKNRIEGADLRLWEHAKKNDVVKHMLRPQGGKPAMLVEETIDTGDEGETLELVEGLNDVEVLEAMQGSETRPAVLKAIAAKLKKLGPTPEQEKAIAEGEKKDAANRKAAARAQGKPAPETEPKE